MLAYLSDSPMDMVSGFLTSNPETVGPMASSSLKPKPFSTHFGQGTIAFIVRQIRPPAAGHHLGGPSRWVQQRTQTTSKPLEATGNG